MVTFKEALNQLENGLKIRRKIHKPGSYIELHQYGTETVCSIFNGHVPCEKYDFSWEDIQAKDWDFL